MVGIKKRRSAHLKDNSMRSESRKRHRGNDTIERQIKEENHVSPENVVPSISDSSGDECGDNNAPLQTDAESQEESSCSDNDFDNEMDIEGSDTEEGWYSCSEHEDDDDNEEEEDPALYEDAPITVGESMLSILTYSLRFSLTGVALSDLLKLIAMHCRVPNLCKKSLFLFKKHFDSISVPLRRRFYCSFCWNSLHTNNSICEPCTQKDPAHQTEAAYWIEVPLSHQLQTLYKRPGFLKLLRWRFRRTKQDNNNYEDIYDGEIYKELSRPPNLLSNKDNLSFTWSTDGVALFKSSKNHIWPFYLSINELPYSQRIKKENLLLAGLWFGPTKPCPSLFLNSICDDLKDLENGVNIEVPNKEHAIRVRAQVICGTCDLPARALFLNMKLNEEYGCQKCLIRSVPLDENSTSRIYPQEETLKLRTQDQTDNFAREALVSDQSVYGVKGPSIISRLTRNYIRATAVDSIDCVFLGVVKALLILWFQPDTGMLKDFAEEVDEKLRSITPPDFVPRLERSMMKNLKYLKAYELKTWFFYYSLPILKTIMSEVYFENYALLVYSIHSLNQASVSEEMISLAESLLMEFVTQFSDLYGRQNMTANIHQLRHLPQTVRDFGPLWTTSCSPFNNANGILKKLVAGTKFSESQICWGVAAFMKLPELNRKLQPNTPLSEFCELLTNKQTNYKNHKISTDMAVVGIMGKINQLPTIVGRTLRLLGISYSNVRIFHRFLKSGILYTSELYRRTEKSNSMYVKYEIDGRKCIGLIHSFVKLSNCDCRNFCHENCDDRYIAIVKKCETTLPFPMEPDITISFIHQCRVTDTFCAVEVSELCCVCFCIEIQSDNVKYIIEPVNMLETE